MMENKTLSYLIEDRISTRNSLLSLLYLPNFSRADSAFVPSFKGFCNPEPAKTGEPSQCDKYEQTLKSFEKKPTDHGW